MVLFYDSYSSPAFHVLLKRIGQVETLQLTSAVQSQLSQIMQNHSAQMTKIRTQSFHESHYGGRVQPTTDNPQQLKKQQYMSENEIQQQMEAMRALDEPMPQVGIFWYDPEDKAFFGVRKQELTPKQAEEAADNGLPFINYPHLHRQIWAKEYFRAQATGEATKFKGDYTQVPRGRVTWNINKFIVFVGQWAKPIETELSQMIEEEFALPYFEFVYDEHWDLGHGWSGDM